MPNYSSNPTHIAIIMDGNGRWAKKRKKRRILGHKEGVKTARNIIEACMENKIKYLTLYTFSMENWHRPKNEVNDLMALLLIQIKKELQQFIKNKICLNVIGDMSKLPKNVYKELVKSIEATKEFNDLTLNVALSYSSKWEITHAIKEIAIKTKKNALNIADINEKTLSQFLQTKNQPDPELLIRTGGEKRISNFLLYQLAYTELYFTDVFWPEFDKKEFTKALEFYHSRQRRFGKTSEQITKKK